MKGGAQTGLLLFLLAAGCGELPVQVGGCAVVSVRGCQLPDLAKDPGARTLRLFVPVGEKARVMVLADGKPLQPDARTLVQGGHRLLVLFPPGATRLRVFSREGAAVRRFSLDVSGVGFSPWLQQARQDWESNQVARAEAALRSRLDGSLSGPDRAEALGVLGRIRREQNNIDGAEALLRQALDADRAAGLWSNEAKDTLALAALLVQDRRDVYGAEALLTGLAPIFVRVPEMLPWVHRHRGTYRKLRGDLDGALAQLEQGRLLGERFGDDNVLISLRQGIAGILQEMGRFREANEELAVLADAIRKRGELPCLLANVLESQGGLGIVASQAQVDPKKEMDPVPPLEEALLLRRSRCEQRRPIASTLTRMAEAALLAGKSDRSEALVAEAEQALLGGKGPAERDAALSPKWAELRGQIALSRGRWAEAESHFGALIARAQGAEDLAWRAEVGLARAALGSERRDEAERRFERAEALLDLRRLDLSVGEGRIGYLARHEQGTAAYLDLLLSQGRLGAALRVLRHARSRGLRDLFRIARLQEIDTTRRTRWEAALLKYQGSRTRLDQIAGEMLVAALDRRAVLQQEQRLAELQLREHLDEALGALGEPAPVAQRPPEEQGEVMLACHPRQGQRWFCLIARGEEIRMLDLPGAPTQGNAAAILTAAGELLDGATRLTVLPYGQAMEQIDFAQAQRHGQALGENMAVVHALDIAPRIDLSPGPPGQALLLIDPARHFGERQLPQIEPLIAQGDTGWRVTSTRRGQGMAQGGLRASLEQGALLFYFGHAATDSNILRRRLVTDEEQGIGIQVADVLMLRQGPRQVVLLGCETAAAREEGGGMSGLGLAQAFLLRGASWAIASTREIEVRVGQKMGEALFAEGIGGLVKDPARRLWQARRAVRAGDTSAFRLMVP